MKKQKIRNMKDCTLTDRKQILLDMQLEPRQVVMKRHNVSSLAISHIQFFHGRSTAKQRGYYYRDLLQGARNPMSVKILKMRDELGMNSAQVAKELGLPLDKVNEMWVKSLKV